MHKYIVHTDKQTFMNVLNFKTNILNRGQLNKS